jgi:adenylylsulfate kinase-like enzyme
LFPPGRFLEIFVKCDLEECIRRDPNGLYKKALLGEIQKFTGISDVYEEPEQPDLILETGVSSLEECVDIILRFLREQDIINPLT